MTIKREITKIIIHCSATPEDKDFTTNQIKDWHLRRGFSDIGYHYVIHRDGTIHKGRPIARPGAHTLGHNLSSIGICYVGGCDSTKNRLWAVTPKDTRTWEQRESLIRLLKELKAKYPTVMIYGHRDFAKKACPSFDARKEYAGI